MTRKTWCLNRTSGFRRAGLLVAFIVVSLVAVSVQGVERPARGAPISAPDVISIDGLKAFGELERLPVAFRHDKHTEALAKEGKDCLSCHLKDEQTAKRSLRFKRLADESKDQVMDTYHAYCVSCHNEAFSAGKRSGPITCGECHQADRRFVSGRVRIAFDKSLHYRHSQAAQDKCQLCHHEFDEKAEKLVYREGKESNCVYCHGQATEGRNISYRQAAHLGCLACHETRTAASQKSGPVDCGGCHDERKLAQIETLDAVPRLKRGQPEVTFVRFGKEEAVGPERLRMPPVPFDHAGHERYNQSCLVCHHASLQSCADCHPVRGSDKGGQVNLERAMHGLGNDRSCLGCHVKFQAEPACAGCHVRKTEAFDSPQSCRPCHTELPEGQRPGQMNAPQRLNAAQAALALRNPVLATFAEQDIPETVVIDDLAEQWQPARLPHRRIVNALMDNLKESKLAGFFHQEPGTLCQGCHHNSPVSKKPPKCGNCHGQPFYPQKLSMPGLKAAYHQQCMGCHREMGLEKPVATACAACHQEKG